MAATFQSIVNIYSGSGVPGEQYDDSPSRALPYTIVSASSTLNIVGSTFCTITTGAALNNAGIVQAGAGGTLGVAGLLVGPKNYALFGAGGQALNPTLTVSNETLIQCATMGRFFVLLPAAANVGDWVIFDDITGAVETIPAGDALPVGKSWAYGIVSVFSISGAGLAVIDLNPGIGVPT